MPTQSTPNCPHDLRPGIKVCYHCRHDAKVASAARRNSTAKRVGIGLLVIIPLAAVAIPKVKLLNVTAPPAAAPATVRAPETVRAPGISGQTSAAIAQARDTLVAAPVMVVATPPVSTPVELATSFAPVIPSGPVQLPSGATASIHGDTVVVDFDLPMLRTRRPEKFEDIVRRSLGEVYGPRLDSIISTIPRGSIVQVDDLFKDLPHSGFHIALGDGSKVTVWPQVKDRSDGPLVYAYHAVVKRQ